MKAGFAHRDITPKSSVYMAGFDRRTVPSNGCLDPILVSVLALEDNSGNTVLFFSYDLLGVDSTLGGSIRKAVHDKLGVPEKNIWISATHTHSAPACIYKSKKSYDAGYVEFLTEQSLSAAEEALRESRPAEPCFGYTELSGLASRRNQGRDGSAHPMPLLSLRFDIGDQTVSLCRIACHPTVLDEKNTLISRDLPGAAAAANDLGKTCLFLNGACGDISTRFTRNASTPEELARLGQLLGKAIQTAECRQHPELGVRITAAEKRLLIRQRNGLEEEERLSLMQALREKIEQCTDEQAKREYDSRLAVLERTPDNAGAERPEKEIMISAVDLGPLMFFSLPFEVGSEDGAFLEKTLSELAGKPAYIACYSNGYDGYLPSGVPLNPDSSYEDIASKYGPEVRKQILEAAKQCVQEIKA